MKLDLKNKILYITLIFPVIFWGITVFRLGLGIFAAKGFIFPEDILYLTISTPLLYYGLKRYIWAKFFIVGFFSINLFYLFLLSCGMYLSLKYEKTSPQNIKKDILVGAGLFVLFPLLWGLSLLLK